MILRRSTGTDRSDQGLSGIVTRVPCRSTHHAGERLPHRHSVASVHVRFARINSLPVERKSLARARRREHRLAEVSNPASTASARHALDGLPT